MDYSAGVAQVLETTSQAAPKMTEALTLLGDGRMGDGIKKLFTCGWDGGRNYVRLEGIAEGRIEATVITGLVGILAVVGSNLYTRYRCRKEAQQQRWEMLDMMDEMQRGYEERLHTPAKKPGGEEVADRVIVECPLKQG